MSTRSGRRIHGSLHENIVEPEIEQVIKSERKTRSRRVKDIEEVNVPKSKKRNNYVSYPSEDEVVDNRALPVQVALKEQDLNISVRNTEEVTTGKLLRQTRRTKKLSENVPDDAPIVEDMGTIKNKKKNKNSKKKKEKSDAETNENDGPTVITKKSKRKKGKNANSITETHPESITIENNMNKSNGSVESFHSAAGSPVKENLLVEIEKPYASIHKAPIRASKRLKADSCEDLESACNSSDSQNHESKKVKLSYIGNDDSLREKDNPSQINFSFAKSNNALELNIPVEKERRKSSLKNSTFDKTDKPSKRPTRLNSTIEKSDTPIKVNRTFEPNSSSKTKSLRTSIAPENPTQAETLNSTFDKSKKSRQSLLNTTFEKSEASQQPTLNTTFEKSEELKHSTLNITFEKTENCKQTMLNSTFEKSEEIKPTINTTFEKSTSSNQSPHNKTFEKFEDPKQSTVNTTFDKSKESRKSTLNNTFEKSMNSRKSTVNTTYETSEDSKEPTFNSTFYKDPKLNSTFDKNEAQSASEKSSIISSDSSANVTFDKSDETSRISITSDDSRAENIVNTTPLLIESSRDESQILEPSPAGKEEETVFGTPLKREGTFTKDGPDVVMSPKPKLSMSKTPVKRMSLSSPGSTPFPFSKSTQKEKTILNVTRSIEKSVRRSSSVDLPQRNTKVMFCSPDNNPAVVMQQKRKVIKSSIKGSNKSFVFDENVSEPARPLGRKRSYTQNDAGDASSKRTRLASGQQQQSVARLSRPRTMSATVKPTEPSTPSKKLSTPLKKTPGQCDAKPSRTKLPNFAALHQRRFAKMESLDECQERKAKRARQLLTPTGAAAIIEKSSPKPKVITTEPAVKQPPVKSLKEPVVKVVKEVKKVDNSAKTPKLPTLMSLRPGYTRFGFKMDLGVNPFSIPSKTVSKPKVSKPNGLLVRQASQPSLVGATSARREAAKQAVMREPAAAGAGRREAARKEGRATIKGVRTNRRFELQMLMRNVNA